MNDFCRYVEGYLRKNDLGCWEVHELELGSGSLIEVLSDQGWMTGVIERDGGGYVFFDLRNHTYAGLVDGLQARIRVTFH